MKRLLAYAIMAVAKKEVVSKRYTKRKPQSVTSGAFFRLVVTVVSVSEGKMAVRPFRYFLMGSIVHSKMRK